MESIIARAWEVAVDILAALLSPLLLLYIVWVVLTGKTLTSYLKFSLASG